MSCLLHDFVINPPLRPVRAGLRKCRVCFMILCNKPAPTRLLTPPLPSKVMISKGPLFALSLFPYIGFLWYISRSTQMPRLALYGFYGTLVFVAVTIPAGIYAQVHYGAQLANIDWLHGGAESFLTISNILIVLGFGQAVIKASRE